MFTKIIKPGNGVVPIFPSPRFIELDFADGRKWFICSDKIIYCQEGAEGNSILRMADMDREISIEIPYEKLKNLVIGDEK